MINVNQITAQLAKLPDQSLQRYAMMHKDDPYIMSLALAESNRRKEIRGGAQMNAPQQPTVAQQAIQAMAAPMPENVGIGQLPAGNMNFAGGGIVAFAEGGDTDEDMFPQGESVLRMAGGGAVPRFNGATGSFMGPVMTFQQFLASQGLTTSEFANASPRDQQILREAFKSTGMGAPSAGAAPAQAAPSAASSAASSAAPPEPGRAYSLAKGLGKFARSSLPTAAGLETLGNLGSYKFQEPGLDTSVSGVVNALGRGEYGQAGKSLIMGLPEAGLDLVRSGASIGDYLLPGQPLSSGLDQGIKALFGDKIRTPSDAAEAVKAAQASALSPDNQSDAETQRLLRQNADAARGNAPPPEPEAKSDRMADLMKQLNALTGGKTGPAGPAVALPTSPADIAKQYAEIQQSMQKDMPESQRAMLEDIALTARENATERRNRTERQQAARGKFGEDYEQRLKAREERLGREESQLGSMSLLQAGLAIMGGRSPHAMVNIAAGAQVGMKNYQSGLDKLAAARDKLDDSFSRLEEIRRNERRLDEKELNAAEDEEKKAILQAKQDMYTATRENFKFNNEQAKSVAEQYFQTARSAWSDQQQAGRHAADMQQRAALGLMQLMQEPSELRTLRGIAGDPKLEALYGRTSKQDAALLQEYIKNPTKLKLLEQADPAAAALIRQKIMAMGAQPVRVENALP